MELRYSSEFQELAKEIFGTLEREIKNKFSEYCFEHIGSTSILGCLTKGDIDFYLEVDPSLHDQAIFALQSLGFRIKSDTHRDENLCMLGNQKCAVQVVAKGSEYEFFKIFRDELNSNPWLVEE